LDEDENCISWQHLPEDIQAQLQTPPAPDPTPQNLHALSRAAIARAVEHCGGNISQAARVLGISRQTVYRRLARAAQQA